jgi:hypothetical protein
VARGSGAAAAAGGSGPAAAAGAAAGSADAAAAAAARNAAKERAIERTTQFTSKLVSGVRGALSRGPSYADDEPQLAAAPPLANTPAGNPKGRTCKMLLAKSSTRVLSPGFSI